MPRSIRFYACILTVAAITSTASVASAVTCTIGGKVAVEPLDGYYCDTSAVSNCTGWREVDLDSARGASAKPLRYMRIEIWQGATYLAKTHTASNGTYNISFTLPGSTCTGQKVTVQHWMERIHESDFNVFPPRYRFSITAYDETLPESQMLGIWRINYNLTLTGSTTALSVTFPANTTLQSRLANLYYTANSAITEVSTWTTRISGHFASKSGSNNGIFRLIYGPDNHGVGGGTNALDWAVVMQYDVYNRGMTTRHEIGHAVREALHNRVCQFMGCSSYLLNDLTLRNYFLDSCEYGSAAFNEGLANFFAMRSVTLNDTNVWHCTCADDANQDICSELSNGAVTGDGYIRCGAPYKDFVAIGDRWITSSGWCKKVKENLGCAGCSQDPNGYCTYSGLYGWRNVVQVARFLWDLIDTSTDGGYDTIDYTIGGFVTAMQGMSTGYGVDGSCRESERASVNDCNPVTNGDPVTGGTGSRDAYNIRDICDLLPENESWVQSINCVSFATDN